MTDYIVFFRALTDAQRNELNAGGWSSPIGIAYGDCEPFRDKAASYAGAIEFDLFEKAAFVRECPDKDELYDLMQNHGPSWACEPTIRAFTDFPRSMSKGDIIYDCSVGEWTCVASNGFEAVADEVFISYLRSKLLASEATPVGGASL